MPRGIKAEKKVRDDQDKIGLSYQKDDPLLLLFDEAAHRYEALRVKRTTVPRIFVEERAALYQAGCQKKAPKAGAKSGEFSMVERVLTLCAIGWFSSEPLFPRQQIINNSINDSANEEFHFPLGIPIHTGQINRRNSIIYRCR